MLLLIAIPSRHWSVSVACCFLSEVTEEKGFLTKQL
jgi:hypothetical protein